MIGFRNGVVVTAAVALVAVFLLPDAQAQQYRLTEGWYVAPRTGFNTYMGPRDGIPRREVLRFFQHPGVTIGLEGGRTMRLGDSPLGISVGVGYIAGSYPRIVRDALNVFPLVGPNPTTWRHTMTLTSRIHGNHHGRISPYAHLGAGMTVGRISLDNTPSEWRVAFSPAIGGGIDIGVNEQIGIFAETTFHLGIPRGRIDGADQVTGGFIFDLLGFYGGGVRINLLSPFVAPAVVDVTGPEEFLAGQEVTFTALVNERASKPLRHFWDMGDGTRLTGLTVTHRFTRPGTYAVRFTSENQRASDSRTLTIVVVRPRPPDIEALTRQPEDVNTLRPVRYSAAVTGDGPLTYRWNFGDGRFSDEQHPTHRFRREGTYAVRLRVESPYGVAQYATEVTVVTVEDPICSLVSVLDPVLFAAGSSELTDAAAKDLRATVQILHECPETAIELVGYAVPDEATDPELAENRARMIEAYLLANDIDRSRILSVTTSTPPESLLRIDGMDQWRRLSLFPVRRNGEP
jgi:outer membrane protein OmpA-like peptidoglycan-associated protein